MTEKPLEIKIETEITVKIGEVSLHLTRDEAKKLRDKLDSELGGSEVDKPLFGGLADLIREAQRTKPPPWDKYTRPLPEPYIFPQIPFQPYERYPKPDWAYRPEFAPWYAPKTFCVS